MFAEGFNKMCTKIFPDSSQDTLDSRRVGDLSYVRLYDLSGLHGLRKTKERNNIADDSDINDEEEV